MPIPQGMGMPGMGSIMGQMPNTPTVKELWKDEKTKYRHWMILFGIGIAVIFGLLLASLILNISDETNIKNQMINYIMAHVGVADQPNALAAVGSSFRQNYIIIPSIQLSIVGVGLLLFISTLIQSYQAKSFHKLSSWGTMVIGLGAIFSVVQLFRMIGGSNGAFDSAGGIFQFINYFLFIGVYFSGSSQVSRIRRMFAQAFRVEQMKNSPEYKAAMEQMQQMQNGQTPNGFANGPFGPTMGTAQGAAGMAGQQPGPTPPPAPVKSQERQDLESMTVADLTKVAKQLEISGTSSMKKTELVEAILRVTDNK